MGDKVGKIHMKKQNLDKMGGRKISALRKTTRSSSDESSSAVVVGDAEKQPVNKKMKKN